MRLVPMNTLVIELLKSLERKYDHVFYNPKTKSHLREIKTGFKKACEDIGLPDLRFHDLRHTAAPWMISGGVDLVTVSEILGHSDIKMTLRYSHPTPENRRRAVDILASAFGKKSVHEKAHIHEKTELSYSLTKN